METKEVLSPSVKYETASCNRVILRKRNKRSPPKDNVFECSFYVCSAVEYQFALHYVLNFVWQSKKGISLQNESAISINSHRGIQALKEHLLMLCDCTFMSQSSLH